MKTILTRSGPVLVPDAAPDAPIATLSSHELPFAPDQTIMVTHCACDLHDPTFGCHHEPHPLPEQLPFGGEAQSPAVVGGEAQSPAVVGGEAQTSEEAA